MDREGNAPFWKCRSYAEIHVTLRSAFWSPLLSQNERSIASELMSMVTPSRFGEPPVGTGSYSKAPFRVAS